MVLTSSIVVGEPMKFCFELLGKRGPCPELYIYKTSHIFQCQEVLIVLRNHSNNGFCAANLRSTRIGDDVLKYALAVNKNKPSNALRYYVCSTKPNKKR